MGRGTGEDSTVSGMPRAIPRSSRAYAAVVVSARFLLVPAWVAAACACVVYLPSLRDAQLSPLGEMVPRHAAAYEAERESNGLFRFPLLTRTVAVHRDPDELKPAELRRLARFTAQLRDGQAHSTHGIRAALPMVNAVRVPPVTREARTTALLYLFGGRNQGVIAETNAARELAGRVFPQHGRSFTGVTGAAPARAEQGKVIEDSLVWVELATLALVIFVVSLHFRAPGSGLFDLAVIAIGYVCATRVLAWAAQRLALSIPHEVEPVIVVLLFGVLTDYTIFYLSRFRSKLETGIAPRSAAKETSAELLPIVLTAGLTVAGASSALAAARLGFFQAFGPGMALSMLIALLVALTFVPAALAIAGPALFWPRGAPREAGGAARRPTRRLSRRVAAAASGHPVPVALVAIALLAVGASGLHGLRLGNPLIEGLPANSEPREAYAAATKGFAPGFVAPTLVVVEGNAIVKRRAQLARLERLLSRQPGVAVALGPREQPLEAPRGAVLSRTGNAARVVLILRRNPYSRAAMSDVHDLRHRLPRLLAEAGLGDARGGVAGDTAISHQTISHTIADLERIAPIACLAIFLMLALFLRALRTPLFLLAASLLALAASLGITTYVFQGLLGHDSITYLVPFAAAVLLVSLGSDYNVYLVGRIKQEVRVGGLQDGVRTAAEAASVPIAVAALVLACSFALLVIVPLRSFRELAFTMFAGLLIDAFLVRSLLVPALIALFGLGRRPRRSGRSADRQAHGPGAQPAGTEPAPR